MGRRVMQNVRKKVYKIYEKLHNKKGTSLIELVVTFALIGIFLAMSSQLISSALHVYYKIQSISYGKQVADVILDKIGEEVTGAQVTDPLQDQAESDVKSVIVWPNKIQIKEDREGSDVTIERRKPQYRDVTTGTTGTFVDVNERENQLVLRYAEVKKLIGSGDEAQEVTVYEAVDWTFDEKAYMDYDLTELKFSIPNLDISLKNPTTSEQLYKKNVIKVEITIKHKRFGTYKATRYMECFDFQTDDDFKKIVWQTGPPSP